MTGDGNLSDLEDFLLSCLDRRPSAIGYALSLGLRRRFPDRALIEGSSPVFNAEAYAEEGLCRLVEPEACHSRRLEYWLGLERGRISRPEDTLLEVWWQEHHLLLLITHWQDPRGHPYHYVILAENEEVGRAFHTAVCAWNSREPDDYILVFDVNGWNMDAALLAGIRAATLDTLILRGDLKEEIVEDVRSFFTAARPTRSTASPGSGASSSSARPAMARRTPSRR